MKRDITIVVVALLLSLVSSTAEAQTETEGFGGAEFNWTQIDGTSAFEAGGFGAKYLSERWYLGGGGIGASSSSEAEDYSMGYGGVLVGVSPRLGEIIKLDISLMAAIGGMTQELPGRNDEEDFIYVLRPRVNLDFQLSDWFKMGTGVGYRQILGVNNLDISNRNASAPFAGITLKFGNFMSRSTAE